eukprot:TRINITY_DN32801_c0_g1_i1.p1 TRINITY_DN32801_c0_g1~~TRINITY_DN32801_c0_g1_i1.p1  ORF type:complete len:891 (-),score=155.01 TRINITY_DN32801_c0_g1_i1:78-2690(-)
MTAAIDDERVVELRVHPGHRGFEVGGRRGSIVVKVIGSQDSRVLVESDDARDARIMIKPGWKALACGGVKGSGEEVLRAVAGARKVGRDCLIAFEVDADTIKSLGRQLLRKQFARRQLRETLGNRSLVELDHLSQVQRAEYLKNLRVQWLVVDASAVFEVEVLLGRKSGNFMQLAKDIFIAVKRDDVSAVKEIMQDLGFSDKILVQRDGAGNVALHHAASLEVLQLLVQREPSARVVKNMHGQSPVFTYLMRRPDEAEAVGLLAESDNDLLQLDDNGISAAMVMLGPARGALEARLPSWEQFLAAMDDDVAAVVGNLDGIAPDGLWMNILAFHCFGERQVWSKGQHTSRSRARLRALWESLGRLFIAVEARSEPAVATLESILRASKGPRCQELDPRQPYRTEMFRAALSLQASCETARVNAYQALDERSVQWLEGRASFQAEDITEGTDGLRFRVQPPEWLESHDLGQVYEDLLSVGSVGAFDSYDGVYEMLQLADAGDDQFVVMEDDCFLARWFAAWLRGLCQVSQVQLICDVQDVLGPKALHDSNFFTRPVAKSFSRICNQVSEIFAKQRGELPQKSSAQAFFRQAAAYVVDINACTFVVDSVDELNSALVSIDEAQAAGRLQIRRAVNGCSHHEQVGFATTTRQGLTLWLEVGRLMLVELHLQLRSFFNEVPFQRLTHRLLDGRFDWPHLRSVTEGLLQRLQSELAAERGRRDEEERGRKEEERRRAEEEEEELRRSLREEEERKRLRREQIRQGKASGKTVAELVEAGFLISEISLVSSSLKEAGTSKSEMEKAGWPLAELKALGLVPSVLRALFDYDNRDLRNVGFSAGDLLKDSVAVSAVILHKAGFSLEELLDAGADVSGLQ